MLRIYSTTALPLCKVFVAKLLQRYILLNMCLILVLSVLSTNLFIQNDVQSLPLNIFQVISNKDSVAQHEDIETVKRDDGETKSFLTNDKMLMERPSLMENVDKEDIKSAFFGNDQTVHNNNANRGYLLTKRAASEQGLSSGNIEKDILKTEKKESEGESRASIPFISKAESDNSNSGSSGSGPSVPGLSQIPGVSSAISNTAGSSSTPTLVMGGFSFVVMPMPGLSMSNIGSALQSGQQVSQFVPGMPSLPG